MCKASLEQSEQSTSALPPPFSTLGRLSLLAGSRTGNLYAGSRHVVRASRDRLSPKVLVSSSPVYHPIFGDAVAFPNILRSEETVRSLCFTRCACVSITHLT